MHFQRFIYLTFLVGALVLGLTCRSATIELLAVFGGENFLLADIVPLSTAIGITAAIIGFFVAIRNRQAVVFTDEVWIELFKVKWPDREETQNSTLTVVVSTVLLATSLALFDFFWASLTERFLYTAG